MKKTRVSSCNQNKMDKKVENERGKIGKCDDSMRFNNQLVKEFQRTGEEEMGCHYQRMDVVARTGERGCTLPRHSKRRPTEGA